MTITIICAGEPRKVLHEISDIIYNKEWRQTDELFPPRCTRGI